MSGCDSCNNPSHVFGLFILDSVYAIALSILDMLSDKLFFSHLYFSYGLFSCCFFVYSSFSGSRSTKKLFTSCQYASVVIFSPFGSSCHCFVGTTSSTCCSVGSRKVLPSCFCGKLSNFDKSVIASMPVFGGMIVFILLGMGVLTAFAPSCSIICCGV